MLCTFCCANGFKCFISGQKMVKGPITLAKSAQTGKKKFFFLLEQLQLVLGVIICAFVLHRKDLIAESYENEHKNTQRLEFNNCSTAMSYCSF